MDDEVGTSIVRIFTDDGAIVGVGFLVDERKILTCAHVVADALGLPADMAEKPILSIHLDFPLVQVSELLTAHVVAWRPLELGDIAGLELDSDPPVGAHAAPITRVDNLRDHPFHALGFPKGEEYGAWAEGKLKGRLANKWVQIESVSEEGFPVEQGFSGTPVWDDQLQAVVGIVVAAERRTSVRVAFAIPVDRLVAAWPAIEPLAQSFVFLCYASADTNFVTRLKTDLEGQGIQLWIDQEGLQPGTLDWEESLRRAIRAAKAVLLIASPNARRSRYVTGELDLAETYKRPIYPVWIDGDKWVNSVPLGWSKVQYIDARGKNYDRALPEIVSAINNVEVKPPPSSPPDLDFVPKNPYKGLSAFTQDDSRYFFGRDKLIDNLAGALADYLAPKKKNEQTARLLAVIGPSGSGKSSVVMAGLLPRLMEGKYPDLLPGSEQWIYLEPVIPGVKPIERLMNALKNQLEESFKVLREDLKDRDDGSARGLHLLATQIAKRQGGKVVLFIDQFEELFTQTASEEERRQFIDLLVTAVTEPGGALVAILTLRADFDDRPMRYPELGQLIDMRRQSVFPMDIKDLRDAIEKPAALPDVRLDFEDDLAGDILFEVHGQPGALPLLQFTLDQLFQRRNGLQLTLTAYREIGGVHGALAKQAASTYDSLPSEKHCELARQLFLRLISLGETEQDTTRRRIALTELNSPDPEVTSIYEEVAEVFTQARLLTASKEAGIEMLEVSHEALIREWKQLSDWLRTARNDIKLQEEFSKDVAEWHKRGRPEDRLYHGIVLAEVQDWASHYAISRDEKDFLDASIALREREAAEKRAERELRLQVALERSERERLEAENKFQVEQQKAEHERQEAEKLFLRHSAERRKRFAFVVTVVSIVTSIALVFTLFLYMQLQNSLPVSVTTLNDSGQGSLRAAIAVDRPQSYITFASYLKGTITLTSGKLDIKKDLFIVGPGETVLSISGGNASRVFDIYPGATVTISGLTIEHGENTSSGGGISNGGALTLTNSIVAHNATSGYGGGIDNYGVLTLTNTMVTDNTAREGGSITNFNILSLINSTISHNHALGNVKGGGGIENFSSLTLSSSTVSYNTTAASRGGGIYNEGPLTLYVSTITHNTSATDGGGIANAFGGAVMLTYSTISENTALTGGGGGIDNVDFGTVTLDRSTISGNKAADGGGILGGGIYWILLRNSTLAGNMATNRGGAIEIGSGNAYLYYITIYGNTAQVGGGGIANDSVSASSVLMETSIVAGDSANRGPDVSGTITLFYPNLIQDITGATMAYGNTLARKSIFGESPHVGSLKKNSKSDPTQTIALQSGSPAINLVPPDPSVCDQNNLYLGRDQLAHNRPAIQGTFCDIGALDH